VDRIAAALEMAKGTIYLYFTSKEELFLACVDCAVVEMQVAVNQAASLAHDPFETIARAIRTYLAFYDEHPHYVELLIQERAHFRSRRPKYFEHRDAGRGPWRELYVDMMAKGLLRNDMPVERLLDTLGALLYGTMYTNYFNGRSVTLEEQYQAILGIAFNGIALVRPEVCGPPPKAPEKPGSQKQASEKRVSRGAP
jgi:AcrR family transcriptional regulator